MGIPMIGEGEFKDFNSSSPMTNDVRTVKSAAKSTSATMWHPMNSVVELNKELDSQSSTAVLVQPAVSSGTYLHLHFILDPSLLHLLRPLISSLPPVKA